MSACTKPFWGFAYLNKATLKWCHILSLQPGSVIAEKRQTERGRSEEEGVRGAGAGEDPQQAAVLQRGTLPPTSTRSQI